MTQQHVCQLIKSLGRRSATADAAVQWDSQAPAATQTSRATDPPALLSHDLQRLYQPPTQHAEAQTHQGPLATGAEQAGSSTVPAAAAISAAVQADYAVAQHQQQSDLSQDNVSVPESLVEQAILELQGHVGR